MLVLFGYIARMARAGTVEALGSDYVRTAVLITNLGVHLKQGRENSVVWVTSLDKGQPVQGYTAVNPLTSTVYVGDESEEAVSVINATTNKVVSTWRIFSDADLNYKPHPKSTDIGGVLKHQLLSERRFFGEFLGTPEPSPDHVTAPGHHLKDALGIYDELIARNDDGIEIWRFDTTVGQ